MKATVIIFIVTGSAKKPTKRKYITAHKLQQQHKMMKKKSPQVGKKKLSPVPDMNNGKEEVIVTDKGTRRKLNVENETDDDDDTRENEADAEVLFTYHFIFINQVEILYFKRLFIKFLHVKARIICGHSDHEG